MKNVLGDADTRFRAGLAEYFAGKYHRAAEDLAAAVAANPDNAIAQQYQAKATEAFPRENTTAWVLPVVIGGVVLLLLVAGLVLLLVLRARRRRAAPAAPIAPAALAQADPAAAPPAAPAPRAAIPAAPPGALAPAAAPPVALAPAAPVAPSAPVMPAPATADPAAEPATGPAEPDRPAAVAAPHCSNCGASVSGGQRFCTACGHPLGVAPGAPHPDATA